jgi:oxalate decarboxylase
MNNDNQDDNLEVGVGDIWFFPQSWGHSIQGVDEEVGCKMVLFFNTPMLPTYNDLSISEILSAFPTEAVSDNTNTPEGVVKTFHQGAIVVNKGYMPPGPFPKSTSPLPESPTINILNGTCASFGSGGYMYEIKNDIFPATNAMSGALVHLDAGTLRDIHWHPNADEMHYVLKGSLKVSVYGIGGAKDTFYLNKGDVGFVPKGFAHYFEALEEETDILLTFNSPNWQTQELSSWLAVVPPYLTAISLNVSTEAIEGFPKTVEDFIDGCPLSPSLPNCYGC